MKKAMSDGLKGATQVGAGLSLALVLIAGVAAPSMAEDLGQDLGVIRACGGDVWRLCKDVLPDVGRIKACVQDKMGQLSKGCVDKLLDSMAGGSFKICKNQTYALCAAARCNVYDGVAYCQCDVKHGDSISLPFPMGNQDVCSINAAGANNKYMISTYSLPDSIASPQAGGAAYTCSGDDGGAYAHATAESASQAPRRRRSRTSTSPCQRGKSFVPALSRRPVPAARRAIKFWGHIRATSPSSNIAKARPPTARRVRQSMSALRLARLRLWRSSSTAVSRPSTNAGSKPDKRCNGMSACGTKRRLGNFRFCAACGG